MTYKYFTLGRSSVKYFKNKVTYKYFAKQTSNPSVNYVNHVGENWILEYHKKYRLGPQFTLKGGKRCFNFSNRLTLEYTQQKRNVKRTVGKTLANKMSMYQ